MDKSLSGLELLKGLDNKAEIIIYPDLLKYKTIDEVFKNKDVVFLLYTYKKDPNFYGHWTVLIKYPDNKTIEFYDPYNYKMDDELKFVPNAFKKKYNMLFPYLTKLLYNSKYKIEYNNYKFQAKAKDINTCGRHVLIRAVLRDINIDEYYKLMKYLKKETGLNYDELVTYLTREI